MLSILRLRARPALTSLLVPIDHSYLKGNLS
jgi:hypothetical protein